MKFVLDIKFPIGIAVAIIFAWLLMISLGANIFETVIIYPNIFHDIPNSLETTMEFIVILGPGDFFPPLGFTTLVIGIVCTLITWKIRSSRYWLVSSLLVIFIGEFLFSFFFFWPRNTIMFTEGNAVHSVSFLEQTAYEFQTGHWIRLSMNAIAAALSFIGLIKIYTPRFPRLGPFTHYQGQI